jgi:hypothetical protein
MDGSWSLPKNISSLTKNVGEPKAPRSTALCVSSINRFLTAGSCDLATSGSRNASRIDRALGPVAGQAGGGHRVFWNGISWEQFGDVLSAD